MGVMSFKASPCSKSTYCGQVMVGGGVVEERIQIKHQHYFSVRMVCSVGRENTDKTLNYFTVCMYIVPLQLSSHLWEIHKDSVIQERLTLIYYQYSA